jgi:hypothetical protein
MGTERQADQPLMAEGAPFERHDPKRFEREVAEVLKHDLVALLGKPREIPCYALIDGGCCPDGWLEGWRHEQGLDVEPLFLQTSEAAYHAKGPHWIELPREALGRAHPLIQTLAEGPGVWQALTIAASPLPIMKLHAHLRGFLGGVLEDQTEVLLRWYDARVGIPMFRILPAATREAFRLPFVFWKSWDWNYHPVELEGNSPSVRPALPDQPTPVPIDETTLKALEQLNGVQRLIARLEEEAPLAEGVDPLPMSPALKHHIAERELEQASSLGLELSTRDQLSILWFAFHVHPDIWRHTAIREEAKTRFAQRGTLDWLLREQALRAQGEQVLVNVGAAFIEQLGARLPSELN